MGIRVVAGWTSIVLGGLGLAVTVLLVVSELLRASALGTPIALLGATLFGGMAVAFVLIGRRLVRPPAPDLAPPRPRVVDAVPPVDESDAAALPMPVSACPDCGFLGIRMPTIHDGLWPGGGETGGRFVCPRCDWQGLPVSFTTPASYAAFVRELNAGRGEETPR